MSILARAMTGEPQERATYANPPTWLLDALSGGGKTTSGQMVNEKTALTLTAYFAAIRDISDDIGTTPVDIMEHRKGRGSDNLPEDPLHWLLNFEPNSVDGMSASSLRSAITAHALGQHGGFAEIERNGGGEAVGLHILDPASVSMWRNNQTREIWYLVGPTRIPIRKENMFHLHGLGYDGITGYALARLQSEQIGTAIATMKSRGAFFGNAMVNSGVFSYPGKLTPDQLKNIYESLVKRHQGAENEWNPLIVEDGLTWTSLSPDPQKSQMLETEYLNIEIICSMFRMPPSKLQHSFRTTNFSGPNAEWGNIEYVMDTLMPWFIRWEQEIKRKLMSRKYEPRKYVKHNVASRLRGDSAAQKDYLTGMVFGGLMTRNEARDKIELNPEPDGDEYFINSTMVPVKLALAGPAPKEEPPQEPEPEGEEEMPETEKPAEEPQEPERDVEAIIRSFEPLLMDAFRDMLAWERDKVARASKQDGYQTWIHAFYEQQVGFAKTRLAAIVKTLFFAAPELGVMKCGGSIDGMANRHVAQSLRDIESAKHAGDLSHWLTSRPETQARNEIELILTGYKAHETAKEKDAG